MRHWIIGCAVTVVVLTCTATAQDDVSTADDAADPAERTGILPIPDFGGDFWSRSHLTGDWNGARTSLAEDAGVVMPIAEEVHKVVTGQQTAQEAYRGLLGRTVKREIYPYR